MEMQRIDPNKPPTCTLTTEQWNVVLGHLDAGQHHVVRPIIDSLVAQLHKQSAPERFSTQDEHRAIPDAPQEAHDG